MNVTKTITIDLNKPRKNVVHLGQGNNTYQIALTLLSNGVPYDVTSDAGGATINKFVKYIKANGVDGSYDTTSTGVTAVVAGSASNKWTVTLDEHATDCPGFAEVFVVFATGSGKILHSFPVTVDVVKTSSGNTDPGQPYYNNAAFVMVANQATKTSAMTQRVGIDAVGRLWVPPGGGGGGLQRTTITITLSGTTYSSDTPYSDISDAVANGDIIEANTPDGLAHYDGQDGTGHIFIAHNDIGDAMRVVRYSINSADLIGRTQYDVDNELIPIVTVATIADSTYTVLPVANYQYIFSNPVISLTINSGYAATGAWSIEFDAPTNVAPSVTIPSGLKTLPASPTFSANCHYEINCNNGYAVIAEW